MRLRGVRGMVLVVAWLTCDYDRCSWRVSAGLVGCGDVCLIYICIFCDGNTRRNSISTSLPLSPPHKKQAAAASLAVCGLADAAFCNQFSITAR